MHDADELPDQDGSRVADSASEPHNLAYLEGEARATILWMEQTSRPVRKRLADEQAAFDLLTADVEACKRQQELRSLLQAVESYAGATVAYNQELTIQLDTALKAQQKEAARAAMFLQQIRLIHDALKRETALGIQQLETFKSLLNGPK